MAMPREGRDHNYASSSEWRPRDLRLEAYSGPSGHEEDRTRERHKLANRRRRGGCFVLREAGLNFLFLTLPRSDFFMQFCLLACQNSTTQSEFRGWKGDLGPKLSKDWSYRPDSLLRWVPRTRRDPSTGNDAKNKLHLPLDCA